MGPATTTCAEGVDARASVFIGQPVVIAVSTLAQRFEDSAFIRDGFVSVVAELVKK